MARIKSVPYVLDAGPEVADEAHKNAQRLFLAYQHRTQLKEDTKKHATPVFAALPIQGGL
jgi:hypothetical protein